MPALLVDPDQTTPVSSTGDPAVEAPVAGRPGRSGRRAVTVVIGLIVLSTVLLVALAIVALTDGGEADERRDESSPTGTPGAVEHRSGATPRS